MRKAQKEQAEKLVCLLDRVHDGIKMSIETGQKDQALDFLGQCQSGAINLGEAIEETEGEGFVTVKHLEEYCETVYQIYEKLRQGQSVSANQAFKGLRRSLTQVKNSIRNDIHVRTEVVFLPYKASMWDSLESVWKAAEEDPECDAYVIPIPYYDRNPDGSFREEHYEGSLYPEYVPVTSYQDYDFEEHRPDVVFIHNPYDECNYVTSVHPFFYARNLKQYTDKLVYIPYFILNEIDPENAAAVKGIEHFCTVPGVIYADKVIVQSENMRQAYVNVMTEFAEENSLEGMDRKYWEEKILGLGSPKVDKVLNTRREDLEIPKEWLRIIEKPDGSWKKIIFYNTSVTTLLQYSEHYLEKMKDVFRVFYENREDVALLWRPHPLIKATIESMRPELWSEYQKMAEAYRKDGWGIYDDTADIDRAVALSDAYYGDMSSVMQLCSKSGMLVILQNINMLERSLRKRHLYNIGGDIGEDVVWDGDKVWFCPQYFNSLFYIDMKTNEIKFLGEFPNEKYGAERLYTSMKLVKGRIYFIPFSAKTIVFYDIEKREFSDILIDENKAGCKLGIDFLFMGVKEYKNYLFILPVSCKAIIRLNVNNQEIDYITNWFTEIEANIFNKVCGFFRKQAVIQGDKLYVPFCNANAVLELDCNNLNSRIYRLGEEEIGYSGICHMGNSFYLSPIDSGDLYKWSPDASSINKIKMYKEGALKNSYAYVGVINVNNRIQLFPANHEEGVLDKNKENIEIKVGAYSFAKEEKEYVAFYEWDQGLLTLIKKENGQSVIVEITSDRIKADIKKLIASRQDYIYEMPGVTIANVITMFEKK